MLLFADGTLDTNITGNVIGSFIAVTGAILLLFLSEWWRGHKEKKEIKKNFIREVKYNYAMIKSFRNELNIAIERLSVGNQVIFVTFKSSNILPVSIQNAYQKGVLYDRLKPTQIAKLNTDVLNFFGNTSYSIERYLGEKIEEWKQEKITTQDLYSVFEWIRDKCDEAMRTCKQVEKQFIQKAS